MSSWPPSTVQSETTSQDTLGGAAPTERLGLSLRVTRSLPLEDLVRLVQLADDLGYDSFWLPETWSEDLVSVLTVLALRTRRIRLAAGVMNVYSRSAALIAQTAATLQEVSEGRFLLGLGTSGRGVVEPWHGVPYRAPLARTRDYVNIIRLALAGRRVDYTGSELAVAGFTLGNAPRLAPPIFIAAIGPRNVRLTGEIADGWVPIFAARGAIEPLFTELRAGASDAGRDPSQCTVAAYVPGLLAPHGDEMMRKQLAHYVGGMGTYYADLVTRMGFAAEAERIRRAWNSGSRSAAARSVSDRMLAACTLGSEPVEARRRLDQYRDQGVQIPVVAPPLDAGPEEIEHTVRLLAP